MRIETDLNEWLSNSSCTLAHALEFQQCDLEAQYVNYFPSTKKYIRFLQGNAFGSGLSLMTSASSSPYIYCSPRYYAHVLALKSQELIYYRFANDDKYFLVNRLGIGFQETHLYTDFYRLLPTVDNSMTIVSQQDGSVWIFPRGQYGHFIYDEVLPQLVSYYHCFGRPPLCINLLSSCSWQLDVVNDIHMLLFGSCPIVISTNAPASSSRLIIDGGFHSLTQSPFILELAKAMLQQGIRHTRNVFPGSRVFLSREGFDAHSNDRISNRNELSQCLKQLNYTVIKPHEWRLAELRAILVDARIILSEPGTTPLLAYVCASDLTDFIVMSSSRCITACPPRYAYSGWRYHLPWLTRSCFTWGKPVKLSENPFSDSSCYSIGQIQLLSNSNGN